MAIETDENTQSEQALRSLEGKVETLKLDLSKRAKENKALKDKLKNSEETAAHYQNISTILMKHFVYPS